MTEAQEAAARATIPPDVLARAVAQAATDRVRLARMVAEGRVKRAIEARRTEFTRDIEAMVATMLPPKINVAIRPKAKRRRR